VTRFGAQSFCGWPFARIGDAVKSEDDPLDPGPPRELRRTLDAIRHLEKAVTDANEVGGVVLWYGAFYGPDTGVFDGSFVEIERRREPLIGSGNGWWSFVHVEDAAAATALALERGAAGSIYNIVDDEPAPVREWLSALALMLGATPPRHVPAWLGRLAAGEHLVVMMTQARAGSNGKAKRDLGWHSPRSCVSAAQPPSRGPHGHIDVIRRLEGAKLVGDAGSHRHFRACASASLASAV